MNSPAPAGGRSVEARLDEIESRTEIASLVAGFCEGLDRRDPERFGALWNEDAEFLAPGGRGNFYGLEQIRGVQVAIDTSWARTFHLTTNLVIKFENPDRATGRADCLAIAQSAADGRTTYIEATYFDIFERRDGEWKIASRTTERWFISASFDLPPNA